MRDRGPLDNGTFNRRLRDLTSEIGLANRIDILHIAERTGSISKREFLLEIIDLCNGYGCPQYVLYFENRLKDFDEEKAN